MTDKAAGGLKAQIRADLTTAMKTRDTAVTGTLRMALAAVTTAEVAGSEAVELADDDVIGVLTKEVKKRHEAAAMYREAGRDELAAKEDDEAEILGSYLPAQLSDADIAAMVSEEIARVAEATGDAPSMKQMGVVIKAVKARAGAQADGARVAATVKSALQK